MDISIMATIAFTVLPTMAALFLFYQASKKK